MLETGTVILNRYTITKCLSVSGMSSIYLAKAGVSQIPFAVKEVRAKKSADDIAYKSLQAEITLLKDLRHPHLINIVDMVAEDTRLLYVMDYVDGRTLHDCLRDPAFTVTKEMLFDFAIQLADVLGYLHSKDICYRDLKPANIMVDRNLRLTLIDLGTARSEATGTGVTESLGTDGFAAPEQYADDVSPDKRSDIYSYGKTLALVAARVRNKEKDASFHLLMQILQTCTLRDPDARHASFEEVYYDLTHLKELSKKYRFALFALTAAFFACAVACALFAFCFFTEGLGFLPHALMFLVLSVCTGRLCLQHHALRILTGSQKRAVCKRYHASLLLNGVMRIDSETGETKEALSFEDVKVSYTDAADDVILGTTTSSARVSKNDDFTMEQDILISFRESYAVSHSR